MARTLYLIDGHSQIYRAYYAPFGNLTSPAGEPTRATHVFCQMLLALVRDRKPDYVAMVLDSAEEAVFRKEIYPDYKIQRQPPPEDLPIQSNRIVQIVRAVGIPVVQLRCYEADDILATLARRLAGPELHVYLVSRDKDLEQLVSQHVGLYDPMQDLVIGPEKLVELRGWPPERAIEAQILIGDDVDNVPGVPGVGPKRAAALLEKYGSARAVVEHADELTPKLRDNVRAFADRLEMVRTLVTLRQDVPVELDLDRAARQRIDWSAARPILQELGLRRLLEQLPTAAAPPDAAPPAAPAPAVPAAAAVAGPVEYVLVNTPEQLVALGDELARQPEFALDTETTCINAVDCDLVGLSLAWKPGRAWYVATQSIYGPTVPLELVRARLGPILADPRVRKVGHNLKYDLIALRVAGLPVAGPLFDTMIAAFVVDPARSSFGLDRLAEGLLSMRMTPIHELVGKGRDQLRMDQVPLAHVCEYAGADADATWRLRQLLEPLLAQRGVDALFYQTEMPLVDVLADMEYEGMRLDVPFLRRLGEQMARRVAELTDEVHRLTGTAFNLDSPRQLGDVLFDRLGFRVVRRTRTARSTDADTLETLARETGHPALARLLEYREIQKLRGTYVDALPCAVSRRTGRVHTSFHQTGAITGRLSSSEPNLQNIPVRTELGRQIRQAFVPRTPDDLLIVADYSQVELRVLAHFCEDEALMQAFAEDLDIHAFVAAQVNGVPLAAVSKEMRARAKAVNFGIIYGQTAFGLSQTTGMSRGEAQAFIDAYFRRYPRIRAFINQCIAEAQRDGHVRTIQGRRRPIPDINSRNRPARALAERTAVNTVVQGSAADLIKTAMIALHARIRRERLPLRMLLQVHDELVCEAPAAQAAELAGPVRETMAGALRLRVPLKVDVACGPNWLEAK